MLKAATESSGSVSLERKFLYFIDAKLNSQTNRTEKRRESLLAVQHGCFVNAKPGLSMEEPDLEQVLPSTRPSRSCRDLNHGRPSTGAFLFPYVYLQTYQAECF
jgi:hypothetical protein